MPRILWRYILKEVTLPTFIAMGVMTLFLLRDEMPGPRRETLLGLLVGAVLRPEMGRADLAHSFALILPTLFSLTIAWVFLVGIIVGVGRMTMDLEIRSMQTAGISLVTIFFPILLMAAALSGTVAWLLYAPQPAMLSEATTIVTRVMATQLSRLEPGRIYDEESLGQGSPMKLHFRARSEDETQMRGVTLLLDREGFQTRTERKQDEAELERKQDELVAEFERGAITQAELDQRQYELELGSTMESPISILASRAAFRADLDRGLIGLQLMDGSLHIMRPAESERGASPGGAPAIEVGAADAPTSASIALGEGGSPPRGADQYLRMRFGEIMMAESFDASSQRRKKRTVMTVPELELMHETDADLTDRRAARAEILRRFSISLSTLALAFIGLPLAVWMRPSGKSVGLFLAAALILVYNQILTYGVALAEESDSVWAQVSVFAPNIAFGLIGLGLWWRAMRA